MKEITGASIILTEACNLSCSYCYEKRKTPEVMDKETVQKAVDFVFDNSNGAKKLSFIWFGGEPLLNFEVLRHGYTHAKVRAQKEGRVLDNLTITNGTIWNDEIESFFKSEPEMRLQLSWDGMPEFQDAERGLSSVLESTLERMKLLPNSLHAHVQITPTMVPKLFDNINYIVEKMGDKANVVLRPISEIPGWDSEGLLERFREQLYLSFEKHEEKIEKVATCEQQIKSSGTCGAGKNFGAITPTGDIYACHRFYFNKNRDFKVGTLDGGFVETAKTDLLLEYTRENIIGCTECDAYELCDRCIAANFGENYDILMPTEANCAVYISQFYAIFNYMKINRPWITNYEPAEISRIAGMPEGMNVKEFVINYVLPMVYELEEKTNYQADVINKLQAKVEYYEKKRRTGDKH